MSALDNPPVSASSSSGTTSRRMGLRVLVISICAPWVLAVLVGRAPWLAQAVSSSISAPLQSTASVVPPAPAEPDRVGPEASGPARIVDLPEAPAPRDLAVRVARNDDGK